MIISYANVKINAIKQKKVFKNLFIIIKSCDIMYLLRILLWKGLLMGKISALIRKAAGKKRFVSAVILAAGSGRRMGDDKAKQFLEIDGLSVLVRSARAFEASSLVDEIVLVTRQADVEGCRQILKDHGITKLTRVVAGGDTRQASAKNGFDAINPESTFVAIHDAARCLITPDMIESVLENAFVHGAAAAACRCTDTIKKSNGTDTVIETVDRENLWMVQTPQIFMADMYRAASYMAEKDRVNATDDCALVERLGFAVKLVDCDKSNLKITYPEDVMLAEAILTMRKNTEA